jgi:NADH-quinone oxidoreductase subunit K
MGMSSVGFGTGLALAVVLFIIGLAGVMARRNIIMILLSIEIMMNAAGLAFIVAGARWGQPDGQAVFLFILAVAAAEIAVALALILQIHRRIKSLDADDYTQMKG